MVRKVIYPVICVGAYPLLALIVRVIIHSSGSSGDVTGVAIGTGLVMFWLTTVLWAVWFIVSLFLSRSVVGSAWWALLYLVTGAVATVVLSRLFSVLRTLLILIFSQ